MTNERSTLTLGQLGPIVTGKTPPTRVSAYFGGDIPFITPRDMDDRKTINSTERFLSEKGAQAVANAIIPAGSVMVSCIGSDMGKVAIAGRECVTNQQINSIITSDVHCADYVYYNLSQRKLELRSLASGSAQPILNKGHFSQVPIEMPPKKEQRRIAHILGMLDDKIELNRRMNRTLEKMAAAIFKSWFIDFDPIRAKAKGQDTGLPQEIADLFPDSLEDSEIGPIPKGWKIVDLPDAIEVNPTRRIARGTPSPHVEMKAMPTKLSRPVRWPLRKFSSGSKFKNGDVLLARITPCLENGKTAFVDFLEEGQIGWGSTEYIVMCSQHPLPPEFTYLLARSERLRDYAIANMTGTSGRQRVPASCFDKLPIAIPSEDVARVFAEFVQPVFRKTRANDRQSVRLAKLRDTLLPNLLSGELKVPDAEKDLEDAE